MVDSAKDVADVAAGSTVLLTLGAWLPPIASILSIAWFALRIWESETVKAIRNREPK